MCDKATCVSGKVIIKTSQNSTSMDLNMAEQSLSSKTKNEDNKSNGNNRLKTKNDNVLDQSVNRFCDRSLKLIKTPSGNLELTMDKDLFQSIEDQANVNKSFYIYLKTTPSGHVTADYEISEKDDSCGQKVWITRDKKGKLLLHVDEKQSKNAKPLETCDICSEHNGNLKKSMMKSLLDITKQYKSACKNNILHDQKKINASDDHTSFENEAIEEISAKDFGKRRKQNNVLIELKTYFLVKLKDVIFPNKTQCFMLAKAVNSGSYEVIFDKEFDVILKQIIKQSEGDDKIHLIKMYKNSCNQYILDMKSDEELSSPYKNVLIVKSPTGAVYIILQESVNLIKDSQSVLSPESLEKIINRLVPCKPLLEKSMRYAEGLNIKSISDSYVYGKTKCNFDEQNILTNPAAILQIKSKNNEIIVDKQPKVKYTQHLRKDLSKSFKIHIDNTQDGEMYIDSNQENTNQNLYEAMKSTNQAISTTCKTEDYSFCDRSKCICRNIQYKSRYWIIEDSENNNTNKIIIRNNNENEHFHFAKNLCDPKQEIEKCFRSADGISLFNNSEINDIHAIKPISSFNINKCCNMSTELLKITRPCTDISPNPIEKSNYNLEKNRSKLVNSILKPGLNWDSLEFLPPQLPIFLRG